MKNVRKRPVDVLTKGEVSSLFDELIPGHRTDSMYLALFALLYRCGLRLSEAIGTPNREDLRQKEGLLLGDLDFDRSTVTIRDGKGGVDAVLSMDGKTAEYVRAWIEERPECESERVFVTSVGGPLRQQSVDRKLKVLAEKAGIEKRVHPHGLRHTMAFELMEEGKNIGLISKILRHADISVTSLYLDHIHPKDVVDTMKGREW